MVELETPLCDACHLTEADYTVGGVYWCAGCARAFVVGDLVMRAVMDAADVRKRLAEILKSDEN